jgi:hypothetical protein
MCTYFIENSQGTLFGSSFSLDAAGLGDLRGDTLVPGVAVFSRRALPIAAWTNGLEIAGVWGGRALWGEGFHQGFFGGAELGVCGRV